MFTTAGEACSTSAVNSGSSAWARAACPMRNSANRPDKEDFRFSIYCSSIHKGNKRFYTEQIELHLHWAGIRPTTLRLPGKPDQSQASPLPGPHTRKLLRADRSTSENTEQRDTEPD